MQPARTLRHRTGASVAVGLGGLLDNPLRTALSTLGVVIGVGALVSILAVGDGVERYAREQIERTTDLNFIAVQSRGTELVDGLRLPRRDTLRFGAAEAAALSAVVAPTAHVDLIAQLSRGSSPTVQPADGSGLSAAPSFPPEMSPTART
jgi:hypothetical protein